MLVVCAKGSESGIRGLETTAVESLIGSVEPVTRRILGVIPFAPPVVDGGILRVVFMIFVVER